MFSILRRSYGAAAVIPKYNKFSSLSRFVSTSTVIPKSDPPDVVAFPRDFCNTVSEAVDSFDTMFHYGLASIYFYNIVFSNLAKRGAFTTVLSLVKQLEESSQFNDLHKPDIHTWVILIQCHSRQGKMSSAISLFHKIIHTGHYPTTQTLNHLLDGFCCRRQIHNAMLFYKYIILKNVFLLNHDSYLILINGLCEIGETQLAIKMLRQALLIDKEPKDYCDDDDDDALKCCYNSIIFRLCKDRLVNQAYDLYSEMIHVNNIKPNDTTYENLTYGYCILGQFKQAMELLRYEIGHHTLVTEQEVKSTKCAAALMIKGGVKPNAASYHSVIRRRLYEKGPRSVVMNNIARIVEELLRAKHFPDLEINKYD